MSNRNLETAEEQLSLLTDVEASTGSDDGLRSPVGLHYSVGSTRNPYRHLTQGYERPQTWEEGLRACLRSKQFWLNAIYLVYSIGLYVVDLNGDIWPPDRTNYWYRFFTILHMLSAQLYIWSWTDQWCHMHLYPEYLNFFASVLFYYASTLYRDDYAFTLQRGVKQFGKFNRDYWMIRYMELGAAGVEAIAAVGWVAVWFKLFKDEFGAVGATELCGGSTKEILETLTSTGPSSPSPSLQPRGSYPIPNAKGWTLQDPDLWANATVILASGVYFLYQIEILLFDDTLSPSVLYLYGDFFYCANALFYILATMRDCEVFQSVPELKWLYICTPVGEERKLNTMRRRRMELQTKKEKEKEKETKKGKEREMVKHNGKEQHDDPAIAYDVEINETHPLLTDTPTP